MFTAGFYKAKFWAAKYYGRAGSTPPLTSVIMSPMHVWGPL